MMMAAVVHALKLFAVVSRAGLCSRKSRFISDVMKAVFCFMLGNSSVELHGFSVP
jgi:hypothetical protein